MSTFGRTASAWLLSMELWVGYWNKDSTDADEPESQGYVEYQQELKDTHSIITQLIASSPNKCMQGCKSV